MTGPTRSLPTILLLLTAALGACGRDTTVTLVPEFWDAGAPTGPVRIAILPYDPDAIRDSLAAAYGIPRPERPDLMAWFTSWQPPELSDTGAVATAWRATRDTVERLADSLRALDRRAPGYRAAYGRFRSLYDRFTQRSSSRNALYREATAEVRDLAQRAGRAADSLRRWEEAAWGDYDTAAVLAAGGRDTLSRMAQDASPIEIELPAGHWWIVARAPVEGNPFLERRWRVAVVAAGFPYRVPLDPAAARTVWRH